MQDTDINIEIESTDSCKEPIRFPTWLELIAFVSSIALIFYSRYGISFDDPSLYYLNWEPGMYSLSSFITSAIGFVLWIGFIFVLLASMVIHQSAIVMIPFALLVSLVGFINSPDSFRYTAKLIGTAQEECYYPDTFECVQGKLEKAVELGVTDHLNAKELDLLKPYKLIYTPLRFQSSDTWDSYRSRKTQYWEDIELLLSDYPSYKTIN